MLRPSTWLALLLLTALIGLTFYLRRDRPVTAEPTAAPVSESGPLFPADLAQPVSLRIASRDGAEGAFAMVHENDGWLIVDPLEAKADPAQAEAALTQIGALRKIATVEVAAADAGLVNPAYTITIGFAGSVEAGEQHLLIGDLTPTGSGYYTRLNDGATAIVSADGIQGLLTLLAFPPYLETPTPSPTPVLATATAPAGTETPGTPGP